MPRSPHAPPAAATGAAVRVFERAGSGTRPTYSPTSLTNSTPHSSPAPPTAAARATPGDRMRNCFVLSLLAPLRVPVPLRFSPPSPRLSCSAGSSTGCPAVRWTCSPYGSSTGTPATRARLEREGGPAHRCYCRAHAALQLRRRTPTWLRRRRSRACARHRRCWTPIWLHRRRSHACARHRHRVSPTWLLCCRRRNPAQRHRQRFSTCPASESL